MDNKFKDVDVKNRTYCSFYDMINIKNLDPNRIKMKENSHKNIIIYYIGYVTFKDLRYVKINGVNGYFEEINGNNYLELFPTNESKEIIKNMKNCGAK